MGRLDGLASVEALIQVLEVSRCHIGRVPWLTLMGLVWQVYRVHYGTIKGIAAVMIMATT